jgi:hypothetical protein
MLSRLRGRLRKEWQKRQTNHVKVKRRSAMTYARPSVKAPEVNRYERGQELTVYPSIKGWCELRPVDDDGIMNTEFIRAKDIRLGITFYFLIFLKNHI